MNNYNYSPVYDSDDYRRKLGSVINFKSNKTDVEGSPSQLPTTSKRQLKKRQPTPYHSVTSKSKLTTSNFHGGVQALFDCNGSDSIRSVVVENILSNSGSSNKLSKGVSKKKVRFSEPLKSEKKSIKRQSTPYNHSANKKIKANTYEIEKEVLFSSHNLDIKKEVEDYEEIENVSAELPELFSVSTSESPKHNKIKEQSKKRKPKKITTKDVDAHIKTSPKNYMEASELVCDNEKYKGILFNTSCFLTEEASDSEHLDNVELDFTPDCDASSSIVYDDISLIKNNGIETNSFEVNEHSLENIKLEHSYDESCESGSVENSDLDLQEETVGTPEYFHFKDMLIIVLHSNSKLYFHGLLSVKVLHGAIEVLGYILTTSSDCAEVFSPRGSSFLCFETKGEFVPSFAQKDLFNALCTLEMESETANELCQNLQPGSAVILCKKIMKSEIAFLEKHTSQQIFPKGEHPIPQCIFQNNIGSWNVLKTGIDWNSLASSIDSTSKLFICGGKSVGKSTMLRYIMNKLLLKYPEILVIDLDPGQPEFTVSGCISATIVKEPVFGPNYTHLRKPSRCLFIPNINISYQPDGYLASVQELIYSCSDLPKIPTIINYMGFTRGLGLEIFSAVVACVQPTCMIEIQSSSSQRNFKKQLSHKLICDRANLLASNVDFIQEFPIHTIESMADTNQGWHLEPRQIREMCVLSYLSKIFPPDVLSLTNSRVPVFVINLSLIKIICNGDIVSPAVANANLVALCSSGVSDTSYTCYGWGVVRGINMSTNELFLLTPLLLDELEQVDHLILGSVSLPPSLYMTSDNNTGLVPFVSQGVLTTLGQIPKRSHLPPRNKQD